MLREHSHEGGFALVQTIVAAGVLGILTVSLWRIVANSSRQEKSIRIETEMMEIISAAANALMTPKACQKSLGFTPAFPTPESALPLTIQKIYDDKGQPVFERNQKLANNNLTIETIRVVKANPNTPFGANFLVPGQVLIILNKEKSGVNQRGIGGETMTRRFNVTLETDGAGNIQNCSSLPQPELEKVRQAVCKDIGGSYVSGKCRPGTKLRQNICNVMKMALSGDKCN